MGRRKLSLAFVVGVSLLQFGQTAHGSALPMSTAEMVSAAEQILFATVEKIVQPDPTRYLLEVHLTPAETLKGHIEGGEFVLQLIGGIVNGIGLFSSEDPQFEVGKPVIIFLRPRAPASAPVVGGRQGCLHVRRGRVVEKRVKAESFLKSVRARVAQEAQKAELEKGKNSQ